MIGTRILSDLSYVLRWQAVFKCWFHLRHCETSPKKALETFLYGPADNGYGWTN